MARTVNARVSFDHPDCSCLALEEVGGGWREINGIALTAGTGGVFNIPEALGKCSLTDGPIVITICTRICPMRVEANKLSSVVTSLSIVLAFGIKS